MLTAAVVFRGRQPADDRLLEEGRARLVRVSKLDDAATRLQLAHEARTHLEEYVDGGGADKQSGQLLYAAALFAESSLDDSIGPASKELAVSLLYRIDVEQCPADDMLLASLVIAQAGELELGGRIVGAVLQGGELREDALRLAIDIGYDLNREAEVLALCQELIELSPDNFHPWEVMIDIRENQSYPEPIIKAYRDAIQRFPKEAGSLRLKLVDRLIEVGDREDARKQFAIVEKQSPELVAMNPIVHAKVLHIEGKADQTSEILSQILAEEPDHVDALLLSARIQLAKNEIKGAIKNLQKIIDIRPADTKANYLLGQAFARNGQQELANVHFAMHRKVLDIGVELHVLERRAAIEPGNPHLPEQIAKLYDEINAVKQAEYWRNIGRQMQGVPH